MDEEDPTVATDNSEVDFSFTDLPNSLAIFPLPGAVLLPGGQLPLNIFEPRYLDMVRDAMSGSKLIGMIQPSDVSGGMDNPPIHQIGCGGAITSFKETDDGRFRITLTGVARFAVSRELDTTTSYRQVLADWQNFEGDLQFADGELAERANLETAMRAYLKFQGMEVDWKAVAGASATALITFLTMAGPFAPNEKQALLETPNIEARCQLIIALMEMAVRGGVAGDDGGQIH